MTRTVDLYSLGGCGGFGMNALLLAAAGRGVLVDFGVGFPRSPLPGVALTVPDARVAAERVPQLDGVVLTHAHDDHCAGLAHLPEAWRGAPVFGPALALATAVDRLDDAQVARPSLQKTDIPATIKLGAFAITLLPVTHSAPQTALLAIDSPAGLIVHSADFKFDHAPVAGPPSDIEGLAALGRRGVRLLLVDSTGALRDGWTGSESSVSGPLEAAVRGAAGQVFVSTFASHLHRIMTALQCAQRLGRKAALLGQRMTQTVRHGIDLGLFAAPEGLLVSPEDLARERPSRRLWLTGGCQGEPQSSLARLSFQADQRAEILPGDVVIISAAVVPGNEAAVGRMLDRFLRLGASVRHAMDEPGLHVSGHASRAEIQELLRLTQPQVVVPIHGDRRHLEAAAALAERAAPAPHDVVIVEKGDRLELTPAKAVNRERLEILTRHLDDAGLTLTPALLHQRQQLATAGLAVVRVPRRAKPGAGVDGVEIEGLGIPDWDAVAPLALQAVRQILDTAPPGSLRADLESELVRRVGNVLRRGRRRRPVVIVHLS